MIFPGGDSSGFFRSAAAVDPLRQPVAIIEVDLIHITGRVTAGRRIGHHHTPCAAIPHGELSSAQIFHFCICVPGDLKRKQQPVFVIDEPGIDFLDIFRCVFTDVTAVVCDGILVVHPFEGNPVEVRFPYPEPVNVILTFFHIECVLQFLDFAKMLKPV